VNNLDGCVNRDNLKTVLQSVYSNKEAVDDELVEVTLAANFTASLSSRHLKFSVLGDECLVVLVAALV